MADATSRPNSKVPRVIEKYDLEGMSEQLEVDLADEFNRAALDAAIRHSDETSSETDLQSTYQTLTDEDVSSADAVQSDFVTPSAEPS